MQKMMTNSIQLEIDLGEQMREQMVDFLIYSPLLRRAGILLHRNLEEDCANA